LAMVFIFIGVAFTTFLNKQVKVDSLMECLPVRAQNIIDIIMYIFTICFDLWLGWQAYQMGFLKKNQIYSMLNLPVSPFLWVMAAAFFVAALAVLGQLINKAREVAGK
jgi:TRAP-type C4-dicarboxylate transport system permease small subunit